MLSAGSANRGTVRLSPRRAKSGLTGSEFDWEAAASAGKRTTIPPRVEKTAPELNYGPVLTTLRRPCEEASSCEDEPASSATSRPVRR